MGKPLRSGEGVVIADLDFSLIDERKRKMDSRGLYSRPELLSLLTARLLPMSMSVARILWRLLSRSSMKQTESFWPNCNCVVKSQ
jgi:hypothetical protein